MRIEYRDVPRGGWDLLIDGKWQAYSIDKEYLKQKAERITAGVAAIAGGAASGRPAAAERREGNSRLVHAAGEFYLGGHRFAPGTYEIKRVATPPTDEPAFYRGAP